MSVSKGTERDELVMRATRAEALYRLGKDALHRRPAAAIWSESIRSIEEYLKTDVVEVGLCHAGERSLWISRSVSRGDGHVDEMIIPVGEHGLSDFVLRTSEPALLDDADSDRRFALPSSLLELDMKSGIGCPIETEDARLGVLCAYSRQSHSFGARDLSFMAEVADLLARDLDREGTNIGLELERVVARTVHDARSVEEVFNRISAALIADLGFAVVEHWVPTADRNLECRDARVDPSLGVESARGLRGERRAIEVEDATGSAFATVRPAFQPVEPTKNGASSLGMRSALAIPIIMHHTPIAVLTLFSSTPLFPSDDLMKALEESGRWLGDFVAHLRAEGSAELRVKERSMAADRTKDQFLMMLCHELRNPLAAIRSAVDVLRLTGTGNRNIGRVADAIDRQSAHMLHLVEGLLDVGRIARGKLRLEPEDLDLTELLGNLVEDHRGQIVRRSLDLQLELPDEPIRIIGDRTRIAQVFDNLFANAIKFTQPGGSIKVSAKRELHRAIVRVVDTGVGITRDQQAGIFRPFVQLRTEARSTGLGLGLTLTKLLVELHGGSIHAESEGTGKGSCFEVRLPIESRDLLSYEHSFHRILLVEDEDDSLLISQLLQRSGHDVKCVETGEQAVDLVKSWRPDVVLCALDLSGVLTGNETARSIRSDPTLSTTALVALTGYGESSESGMFDAQLMKPAALDDIERVIDEATIRIRGPQPQSGSLTST